MALILIASGKLTFDERVVDHRAGGARELRKKVDIRLPGKGNLIPFGSRPVYYDQVDSDQRVVNIKLSLAGT